MTTEVSQINMRTFAEPRALAQMIIAPDPRDHFLNSYSYFDHNIELEDGSFWTIRGGDMHKILNWAQNDPLSIGPNKRIFGSTYIIQNRVTGETVEAELTVGPVAFGTNTHWITAIDPWIHRVYLEDGSYWDIRGIDSISQWTVNDTIILGDGRSEWFGHHDSILINVNLNTYVYANRGF